MVLVIGGLALEKQATDVMVLHVERLTTIADYLVICSGNSERQVKALAETIRQEMSTRFGSRGAMEGTVAGTWILIDYGDIVVHVFKEDTRAYYGVENMWRDAPRVPHTELTFIEPATAHATRRPASGTAWHHARGAGI